LDCGSQLAGRIKTMEVVQAELETHADIIAKNVDGNAVLLVKVQADKSEYQSIQHFIKTWQTLNILIPFAMFVQSNFLTFLFI
jgi:hypothetical protein